MTCDLLMSPGSGHSNPDDSIHESQLATACQKKSAYYGRAINCWQILLEEDGSWRNRHVQWDKDIIC